MSQNAKTILHIYAKNVILRKEKQIFTSKWRITQMNYTNLIIPFIGGLGMFIYGMQIMASGLENAAGNRMKSLLEALTKNKFLGVLLGAFITAVIQSSSATTVMLR